MSPTSLEKLFPIIDRSTMPATQVDYINQVKATTIAAISALHDAVTYLKYVTWEGDQDISTLGKLQSLGDSAQVLLSFHAGACQLINQITVKLNLLLPPEEKIALLPIGAPGEIKWNKDGSAKNYTPPVILEPEIAE